MKIKVNKILIIVLFFVIPFTTVKAQQNYPLSYTTNTTVTNETTSVTTQIFSGIVSRKDSNSITVQSDTDSNDARVFSINDNVRITRNGTTATFNDIQTSDKAVITTNSDTGEIISIDVTAGSVFDLLKLVLVVIGILVLLGLVILALRSQNREHIKTTATTK